MKLLAVTPYIPSIYKNVTIRPLLSIKESLIYPPPICVKVAGGQEGSDRLTDMVGIVAAEGG
jgi:hypothetical protein